MAKYKVTVVMVFPDDLHAEDIKNIAEQRLEREVVQIEQIRDKEGDGTGAQFDSEELTMKAGQMLIDALGDALEEKGFGKRMTEGIFIISNATILSISGDEIKVQVEYEYGM